MGIKTIPSHTVHSQEDRPFISASSVLHRPVGLDQNKTRMSAIVTIESFLYITYITHIQFAHTTDS